MARPIKLFSRRLLPLLLCPLLLAATTLPQLNQLASCQPQQAVGSNHSSPRADPSAAGEPVTSTLGPLMAADSLAEDSLAGDPTDSGADAARTRTTVKKELRPTEAPTVPPGVSPARPEVANSSPEAGPPAGLQTAGGGGGGNPLESILPGNSGATSELMSLSPELSRTLGDTLAQVPASAYNRGGADLPDAPAGSPEAHQAIEGLLPKGTSLFQKDAIDAVQLGQMDCHLRNIDYCVAGMLGTAQKMLPETDAELESRCDEMRATTSCLAIYNKRCSAFRIFALLAPFSQAPAEARNSPLLTEAQRQVAGQASDNLRLPAELLPSSGKKSAAPPPTLGNLMELCQPEAKGSGANADLRQRLFGLAKCINARVPKLTPCLEDLKTAAQVFYEPTRSLPMRPTCCALARFRACAMNAVDNICGLSSFEQLVQSMSGDGSGATSAANAGPFSMLRAIDRVCRQATDHRSTYCREVLPPSGMKAPARRGNKASKLAKALDLISFAPATQDLGAMGRRR